MDIAIPIFQMKKTYVSKTRRLLTQGHTEVWNTYLSDYSICAISTL